MCKAHAKASKSSQIGLPDIDLVPFKKPDVHAINGVSVDHPTAFRPSISCRFNQGTGSAASDCSNLVQMDITSQCFTVNAKQELVFKSTKDAQLEIYWVTIFRPLPVFSFSQVKPRAKNEPTGDTYYVRDKQLLLGRMSERKHDHKIQQTALNKLLDECKCRSVAC
jgi:hypothetical protein